MDKDQEQERKQREELQGDDKYRQSLKRIKVATIALIIVIGLALSVNIGVNATSTNSFCSSCHMMTPQALTWEASSHSSIDCKDCHIKSGIEGKIEAKIGGLYELYHMVTDSYGTPIRMKELIPNENCQKCHNMGTRDVSASGDIIVDHLIHDEKEVFCVTCHAGVAHGKVSENRVTYRTDFDLWDEDLANHFMTDTKYVKPQMEKCMDCHELKQAPLTCETCHTTGMLPTDHKEKDFVTKQHGSLAEKDLLSCDSCHSYMSEKKIKELQEQKSYTKFLTTDPVDKSMTVQQYAKQNTFCSDCHSERPESHKSATYFLNHGKRVSENEQQCLTCHENDRYTQNTISNITCASCHPSGHNPNWEQRHPTPLSATQKFERTCLSCHVEETCTSCHVDANRKD
ncbi:NapC/NirT family cytochrome c [Anaerobacillus sp. CMMVII]|uniref:NapC/NirT family cytochrome c n=1 Tax=Anaerobacillus sp. CMMVII TaxID=2755588 RepID=UPI0021B76FFD|nr:NapC/NirT family cytochrome c [Anaerobacillus sp. CMMVII]MCT8137712.1 NapC/NirT family cytochrome c [Anaerobacillus sp. CMMVII]